MELAARVSIAICGCEICKLALGLKETDGQTLEIIETDYGLTD